VEIAQHMITYKSNKKQQFKGGFEIQTKNKNAITNSKLKVINSN
jgi:hypothetical protein